VDVIPPSRPAPPRLARALARACWGRPVSLADVEAWSDDHPPARVDARLARASALVIVAPEPTRRAVLPIRDALRTLLHPDDASAADANSAAPYAMTLPGRAVVGVVVRPPRRLALGDRGARVLAGTDAVAVDAVVACRHGRDPVSCPALAASDRLGLGEIHPGAIRVLEPPTSANAAALRGPHRRAARAGQGARP
jgi:hypothetical protein